MIEIPLDKPANILEEMGFIVEITQQPSNNPTITVHRRIDYFSSSGEKIEEYDLFVGNFSSFEYALDLIRERDLKPYEKVTLNRN